MKHKSTPEEIAARDAKRVRFHAMVKKIAALPPEERAHLAGQCGAVMTVEGKGLSPINSILCFLQCPGVSVVGGFRQWLKAGRCVRKGEHGLTIWIPLGAKVEAGAGDEEGSGQRFGTGTVFDVGQTAELEAGHPVAVVSPEIAAAFGLENLPNVRTTEAA